jgi:nucleotide-binding universal stress UspA family protein
MGFKKILAAIDYTSLSQTVFEQALELAKANQARLMLFHCVTADTVTLSPPLPGEFGISPQFVSQAYQSEFVRLEQQVQQIQSILSQFCESATREGVPTEYCYKIAEPGQGLCQAAQTWGADLLMLGRRGRKGLTEALLGSVSNYVLHHAPCAVLVIQSGGNSSEKQAATDLDMLMHTS